jgi:hypothetical protein
MNTSTTESTSTPGSDRGGLAIKTRLANPLVVSDGVFGISGWTGLLLLLLLVVPVRAETVRLVATQNAQLDEAAPDTPFQDWGVMDVFSYRPTDTRRVLLQFDLSAIPAGASLTSAKLKIFARNSGVVADASQEIWRVGNDGWNQAAVTWNNFVIGPSNYVAGLVSISGPAYNTWNLDLNAWETAPDLADGKLTVLVKFSAALEGDYFPRGITYYSRAVPNPNNSSGSPDADIVPYLEITYTGNPPAISPPLIRVLTHTNNQLTLAWNTFPGWSYQLQSNAMLGTTNWIACTGTNYASELDMTNTAAVATNQNFFRVRQFSR